MRLRPAKTAERIKVLFGMEILGAQETLYYMRVPIPLEPTTKGRRSGKMLSIVLE